MVADEYRGINPVFVEDFMKDGDIYRWAYNQEWLRKLNDGNNGGTTYWCCSRIGIWNESRKRLVDTFWVNSGDSRSFSEEDISKKLTVRFVANINDLVECGLAMFDKFDDADCVNISHSNMGAGGFYIRKGAKESYNKKKAVLEYQIQDAEHTANYHKNLAERLKLELAALTP
jgi:hypothetical protein